MIRYMDKFEDINIPDFEIEEIVNEGIEEKESFFKYLKRMKNTLGLNIIFIDKLELIILGVVLTLALTLIGYNFDLSSVNRIKEFYGITFLFSPIIYLSMSLYGLVKSKENNMMEIEITCKYNIYQIATFRIFVFSIIGALINVFVIGLISLLGKNIGFVRLSIISISGVFLFSSIMLFIITKAKWKLGKYIYIVLWIGINLWISFFSNKIGNLIFLNMPIWIHFFIAIGAIVIYIKNLKNLINLRRDKGDI